MCSKHTLGVRSHAEHNFAVHTQVIARIEPGKRVVVYGSLALGGPDDRYYLTRTSDADLAIEVPSGRNSTSKQQR